MSLPDKIDESMNTLAINLSDVLTRLLFAKRLRPTELARLVNLPQPTVQRMVMGVTNRPHKDSLQPLADFFQISIDQLKGLEPIPWLEPETPNKAGWAKIPVLTWEQAAAWPDDKDAIKADEELFTDAKVGEGAYGLRMKDASMEPQFPKGTLLIIDPEKPAKDRSYVVATIKSYPEVVFRQLIIDGPYQYLKPISPDFDRFKMSLLAEGDKIAGVLAQARRDYEE